MDGKIGLAALCAHWFQEVGLQGEGGDLAAILRQDYARMQRFLGDCFEEVVAPGVISTVEEAARAAELFRQADVDAVLLVHILWSEDPPLLALLEACGELPLILWNYHPTGALPPWLTVNDLFRFSGTVGLLQGSAPLQRRGLTLPMVHGAPEDGGWGLGDGALGLGGGALGLGGGGLAPENGALGRSLREYGRALSIRREFRGMRAAQIAGRCEVMTGTFVNRETLRTRLGVELVEISAQEYARVCAGVSDGRVQAYQRDVLARWPVEGVSAGSLERACRNTLALDDLVAQHDLHAVAIQDLDAELHRLVGTRPCLCPPQSAARGVAFGMESDLHTTLGLLAAMRAAHGPGMYTEVFSFDARANLLLLGHAGVHDPRLAGDGPVTLVPDAEYRHSDAVEGAWQHFILAAGPVTCVSFYDTGDGYRLTAFEGESLGGPRRVEGFAHALVRPHAPVEALLSRLVERGMTQHFAIVPGHIASILQKWCQLGGMAFCEER